MKKLACSIYDSVAKVYVNPFYCGTKGEALRSFSNAVNDKQMGDLHKHPKDFLLYVIGEWDDVEGLLTAVVPPERLGLASDFVEVDNGGNK